MRIHLPIRLGFSEVQVELATSEPSCSIDLGLKITKILLVNFANICGRIYICEQMETTGISRDSRKSSSVRIE